MQADLSEGGRSMAVDPQARITALEREVRLHRWGLVILTMLVLVTSDRIFHFLSEMAFLLVVPLFGFGAYFLLDLIWPAKRHP
jgi:hypothetical protein